MAEVAFMLFRAVFVLSVLLGFLVVGLMLVGASEMDVAAVAPIFAVLAGLAILSLLLVLGSARPLSSLQGGIGDTIPGAFVQVPPDRSILEAKGRDRTREHGSTALTLLHLEIAQRPNAGGVTEASLDKKKEARTSMWSLSKVKEVSTLLVRFERVSLVELASERYKCGTARHLFGYAYLKNRDRYGREVIDLNLDKVVFETSGHEKLWQSVQPISSGRVVNVHGRYTGHQEGGKRHRAGKPCEPVHILSLSILDNAEVAHA